MTQARDAGGLGRVVAMEKGRESASESVWCKLSLLPRPHPHCSTDSFQLPCIFIFVSESFFSGPQKVPLPTVPLQDHHPRAHRGSDLLPWDQPDIASDPGTHFPAKGEGGGQMAVES